MDVGTAFEMGFMYNLGKPVLGYYNIGETYCTADQVGLTGFDCSKPDSDEKTTYREKVQSFGKGYFGVSKDRDKFTHLVEDFSLTDNLMMIGAVRGETGEKVGYNMAGSFLEALHEAVKVVQKREAAKTKDSIN